MNPKAPEIYVVNGGIYTGEFLVYISETLVSYVFLSIPDLKQKEIKIEDWNHGVTKHIVEKVEDLPSEVYDVCLKQYQKNEAAKQ